MSSFFNQGQIPFRILLAASLTIGYLSASISYMFGSGEPSVLVIVVVLYKDTAQRNRLGVCVKKKMKRKISLWCNEAFVPIGIKTKCAKLILVSYFFPIMFLCSYVGVMMRLLHDSMYNRTAKSRVWKTWSQLSSPRPCVSRVHSRGGREQTTPHVEWTSPGKRPAHSSDYSEWRVCFFWIGKTLLTYPLSSHPAVIHAGFRWQACWMLEEEEGEKTHHLFMINKCAHCLQDYGIGFWDTRSDHLEVSFAVLAVWLHTGASPCCLLMREDRTGQGPGHIKIKTQKHLSLFALVGAFCVENLN